MVGISCDCRIHFGYYSNFNTCHSFWCDLCGTISNELDVSYIHGPYEGTIDGKVVTCSHTDGTQSTVSFDYLNDGVSISGYNMMWQSRPNTYIVGLSTIVQGLDECDVSTIRYETVLWNDVGANKIWRYDNMRW